MGAVIESDAKGIQGVLGIVDDDYDSLTSLPRPSPNILRTETRDIETLLLKSPALDQVIAELGDPDKMRAFEVTEGRDVRDALISRALVFGQLRYLSAANGWSLSFKPLHPARFVDIETWTIDKGGLFSAASSAIPGMTPAGLQTLVAESFPFCPWSILHGKDTLSVLLLGLRNVIGKKQVSMDHLTQMLRVAFHDGVFASTHLHSAVKCWESANEPFRILTRSK